ncbi:MAG TPA: hypothetical protein ENL10_00560 [Candidatus Cloacimonetes bacterium]|nr:hypothetical protein [Candidatus Cloacimonadota bacterium]HHE39979.1 hypothetical protein [Candidatus Cloacimonadota bacterium]
MLKNRSLLILVILLLVAVLTVLSCGRKGSLNPNVAPYIEISDYSGIARPDTVLTDSAMSHVIGNLINPAIYDSLFFQEIYWKAWDVDGVVKSFAYRIGTWDSLSEDWQYDQTYGVNVSEDGWVLHLQPNGEYGIWTPLKERFPKTQVYFTAKDTADYKRNFGKFEVKCKDNYGEESDVATRYFCSWSDIPSTSVMTSQGSIDSLRVGSAILFNFKVLNDEDPFGYGSEAAYYKYRLMYYHSTGTDTVDINGVGEVLDSTQWYSTEGYPLKDEVLLKAQYLDGNPYGKPILRVNEKYADGTYEVTEIQVKTVDKAGIEDPDYASMTFFVRGYFHPDTAPFMAQWATYLPDFLKNSSLNILPHIFVISDYTWLNYLCENEDIPKRVIGNENHYANQFYMAKDTTLTAIWSNNIEVYMKWEYLGQYEYDVTRGRIAANHTYFYDTNLDDYIQYFCDVEYMDIQLDGGTDGLPPVGTIITDNDTGEEWMRLPIYDEQTCKLFGLSIGEHTFRVRSVDFQGAVDPTPAELTFYLHAPILEDEKEGLLIVDDTQNQIIFAVEDSVNQFYQNLTAHCTETIEWFDLRDATLTSIYNMNKQLRNDDMAPNFAPSDIQQYKMILWYANDPKGFYSDVTKVHLVQHYDLMRYYMISGGSTLFTGTAKISDPLTPSTRDFLQLYGGLADTLSALTQELDTNSWLWGTPNTTNSMFVAANGQNGFTSIDTLHLNWNLYRFPTGSYFPGYWIMPTNPLGKISNVTFLNVDNAEPIFSCVTDTLAIHQQFAGATMGTKYTHQTAEKPVYILGFPLYYMMPDDSKDFIDIIFDEVGVAHN